MDRRWRLSPLVAVLLLAAAAQQAAAAGAVVVIPSALSRCVKPQGYTGAMVLPVGAKDPDHCTPEFPGDGAKGHLEYDLIRMPPATLTPNKAASVEACQALCAAAAGAKDGCQYLFYNGSAPLAKRCMLRLKGVAPPKFDLTGPKQAAVVFEVTPNNRYSAYPADPLDWAGLGVDIASFPTFRDAMVACGITPVCVGFKYDPAGGAKPYRTFAGTLWEGVTGKVRTTGPSLNPWAHYA